MKAVGIYERGYELPAFFDFLIDQESRLMADSESSEERLILRGRHVAAEDPREALDVEDDIKFNNEEPHYWEEANTPSPSVSSLESLKVTSSQMTAK